MTAKEGIEMIDTCDFHVKRDFTLTESGSMFLDAATDMAKRAAAQREADRRRRAAAELEALRQRTEEKRRAVARRRVRLRAFGAALGFVLVLIAAFVFGYASWTWL